MALYRFPQSFLSTLSLRRATGYAVDDVAISKISIHALLAESDLIALLCRHSHPYFYPRSPCGERPTGLTVTDVGVVFLSTLSLRRATRFFSLIPMFCAISIHALLAESDFGWRYVRCRGRYFYPRSPCGERLKLYCADCMDILFLSTLSLRRATNVNRQ